MTRTATLHERVESEVIDRLANCCQARSVLLVCTADELDDPPRIILSTAIGETIDVRLLDDGQNKSAGVPVIEEQRPGCSPTELEGRNILHERAHRQFVHNLFDDVAR